MKSKARISTTEKSFKEVVAEPVTPISTTEKSFKEVVAEPVTDLLEILLPNAQIGGKVNAKSWLISDNAYAIDGELITSITNGLFAIYKYFDSSIKSDRGRIIFSTDFTSKGNYELFEDTHEYHSFNYLKVELTDQNLIPIFDMILEPAIYFSCKDVNYRRYFYGVFRSELFDSINGSKIFLPAVPIKRCPL